MKRWFTSFSLILFLFTLQNASAKEAWFRPDFRDTEIQDFLKAMSGIIEKNIVTDDQVKGKITVISPRKIPKSRAYDYLKSVLLVRGFGIVEESDDLIRVVPLKDAFAGNTIIQLGRELDPPDESGKDQVLTQIVPIYGTTPSRLAGILNKLSNTNTSIIDYDDANMVIITGGYYEVDRLLKVVQIIDKEDPLDRPITEGRGNVFIYRLENSEATQIEATLKKINNPNFDPKDKNAPKNQKIDVVAHQESNAIIFVGERDRFDEIKAIIEQLDLPLDQVLLEVLIVEINSDDQNSFGVDWLFGKPGGAQFNSGLATESGLIDSSSGDITGVNTLLGFSVGYIQDGSERILAVLQANVLKDNFAILSAPQILTMDNQEAEINVGEDVPVITGNRISDTDVSTFSYEYRPTGVKLKFTPRINKSQMITLKLYQEVKSISGATDDITSNPTFNKRDIRTVVQVADHQTLVIGGLISTDHTRSVRKVPILGDIPLLGYLFRRTSVVVQRTNLLVFITPHILTNREIADKVTTESLDKQSEDFRRKNR